MNNIEFWNSINKYNEHCNPNGGELVCDQMVKEGLGQTVGGYFEVANYPKYKRSIDKEIADQGIQSIKGYKKQKESCRHMSDTLRVISIDTGFVQCHKSAGY